MLSIYDIAEVERAPNAAHNRAREPYSGMDKKLRSRAPVMRMLDLLLLPIISSLVLVLDSFPTWPLDSP